MIHNHITELREILVVYAPTIWSILKDSPQDRDLSSKIKIVGDYPNLQMLQQLRDYTATIPLRAILSLVDAGSVLHRSAHMGTRKSDNMIIVAMTLTTADPEWREDLGGSLMDFINKNMPLFRGKATPWRADNFVSSGVTAAQPDMYARTYRMWIREIS